MTAEDLLDMAASVARTAARAGADAAEAYLTRWREREVTVVGGKLERSVEARGLGCGLRVERGARQGFASTTVLSREGVSALVEAALEIASQAPEDDAGRLPDPAGRALPDLDLHDPAVPAAGFASCLESALEAEEAALGADPRVRAGEGSSSAFAEGQVAVFGTRGVAASYAGTRCTLACVPVAADGAERQRQYWFESRRFLADLPAPARVGREAAARALRMLGARRLPSGRAAVVIDPIEAARFWAALAPAFVGDHARRGVSFLAGDLGRPVAGACVTLVDDPLAPRAPGSRPFDGEGLPASRRTLVERGVLRSFLYDSRTARRAGAESTGSAVRGYASPPSPGAHAPRLEPGVLPPEKILEQAVRGLYVTHLLGFGLNLATGDYSRGANGWWFEDGRFAHPVHEVTLSGNLRDILPRIALVGNDLVRRSSASSPTFLIDGMVISGRG